MATKSITTKKTSEKTSPSTADNGKKGFFRGMSKTTLLILAIVVCGGIALFTTIAVVAHNNSLRASSAEYDHLRGLGGNRNPDTGDIEGVNYSARDIEMLERNPDYVCWIRIDGTAIDYPVVRGSDNEKYIHTSFDGEENIAGAIFMDYRNVGESLPHIIIFGHNLQRGGMFSDLRKLLNPEFREENNIITLIVNGNDVEFEIFAARLTDIHDPAYTLDFSGPRDFVRFADRIEAPLHATQILTLSTCARRDGGGDARILVHAYRLLD